MDVLLIDLHATTAAAVVVGEALLLLRHHGSIEVQALVRFQDYSHGVALNLWAQLHDVDEIGSPFASIDQDGVVLIPLVRYQESVIEAGV